MRVFLLSTLLNISPNFSFSSLNPANIGLNSDNAASLSSILTNQTFKSRRISILWLKFSKGNRLCVSKYVSMSPIKLSKALMKDLVLPPIIFSPITELSLSLNSLKLDKEPVSFVSNELIAGNSSKFKFGRDKIFRARPLLTTAGVFGVK